MISAGHSLTEIKGYTIAQVTGFIGAIERRDKERRKGDALALRMAQADGKAWGKYMRKLEGK